MVGWHHRLHGCEFEQALELVMDREAGVLQSMGLQKVGHDLATELTDSPFHVAQWVLSRPFCRG